MQKPLSWPAEIVTGEPMRAPDVAVEQVSTVASVSVETSKSSGTSIVLRDGGAPVIRLPADEARRLGGSLSDAAAVAERDDDPAVAPPARWWRRQPS